MKISFSPTDVDEKETNPPDRVVLSLSPQNVKALQEGKSLIKRVDGTLLIVTPEAPNFRDVFKDGKGRD